MYRSRGCNRSGTVIDRDPAVHLSSIADVQKKFMIVPQFK